MTRLKINPKDQKAFNALRGTSRVTWGCLVAIPFRAITVIVSIAMILLVLSAALLVTKIIHDNFETFQKKLGESEKIQTLLLEFINHFLDAVALFQELLLLAIELLNYATPLINLLVYMIYSFALPIIFTLVGQGRPQNNDAGDASFVMSNTPDPHSTISGSTGLSSLLQCVFFAVADWFSSLFKVQMRALGACLVAVFQWLSANIQSEIYRNEYCRVKVGDEYENPQVYDPSNDPSEPNENDPDQKIYDDGTGPGSICPDTHVLVQGLVRMQEMSINIMRDVFISVFPILAGLLKMYFDTVSKILPALLDGLVSIIAIFSPDQPMGKYLFEVLKMLISLIGFLFNNCVTQLMISVVMCIFNNAVALVVNLIKGVLKAVARIACIFGRCNSNFGGDYLAFGNCDWSASSKCNNQSFGMKPLKTQKMCESVEHDSTGVYVKLHEKMTASSSEFDTHEKYNLEYYNQCLDSYKNKNEHSTDTVVAHVICRTIVENLSEGERMSTSLDSFSSESVSEKVKRSCACKYESPVCQSETCCLIYQNILVNQIMDRLDVRTCGKWQEKKRFADVSCVSTVMRSMDHGGNDITATIRHCEGFSKLMDKSCDGESKDYEIPVTPVSGGMCDVIDREGFCNTFRRPNRKMEHMTALTEKYNRMFSSLNSRDPGTKRSVYRNHRMESVKSSPHVKMRHPTGAFAPDHFQSHMGNFQDTLYVLEDSYNVMKFAMVESLPLISSIFLESGFASLAGVEVGAELDHTRYYKSGKLRHVRVENDESWKDYSTESIQGLHVGSPKDWKNTKSLNIYGDSFQGQCADTSGYPDDKNFNCMNDKYDGVTDASGNILQAHTEPVSGGTDQFATMKSNATDRIETHALEVESFMPANTYVNVMYDRTIDSPATWTPADAQRDNRNPNNRVPLTKKSEMDNGPKNPPFTIFDTHGDEGNSQTMERCPISKDFPWERVFAKRNFDSNPIGSLMMGVPKLLKDLEIATENAQQIPQVVKTVSKLMYSTKKTTFSNDASHIYKRGVNLWNSASRVTTQMLDMGLLGDVKVRYEGEKVEDFENDNGGKFVGINPNPQARPNSTGQQNTELCINRLLQPLECCTDDATSYECCYGLPGCMKPFKRLAFSHVKNLDFLLQAQCGGTYNVVNSLTFLPRLIFGKIFWILLLSLPDTVARLLYRPLKPLLFDLDGKDATVPLLQGLICTIVNLYYVVLIAMAIVIFYAIDQTVITYGSDLHLRIRVDGLEARMSMVEKDVDNLKRKMQLHEKRQTERYYDKSKDN